MNEVTPTGIPAMYGDVATFVIECPPTPTFDVSYAVTVRAVSPGNVPSFDSTAEIEISAIDPSVPTFQHDIQVVKHLMRK